MGEAWAQGLVWAILAVTLAAAAPTRQEIMATQPVQPFLVDLGVIVGDSAACVRDPTQVIHVDGTWHFWATHNPSCTDRHSFPRAEVHHYFSAFPDVTGPWNTSGAAVGYTSSPGDWDAWSVFTPGAIYDPAPSGAGTAAPGRWFLWYGAVADGKRPTHESVGLATSSSPFGPWTRSPDNPVFRGNGTGWCGAGQSARVDEADAYVIGGRKIVLVKGVCKNFTALPTAWVSIKGPGSFDPPYTPLAGAAPMITAAGTPGTKGFEQARLFPGPDGLLHMTGHDHGGSATSHFVSGSGGIAPADWRELPAMSHFGLASEEPTPVFSGVPGDRGGVPTHYIQFNRTKAGKLAIHLMAVEWNQTASCP